MASYADGPRTLPQLSMTDACKAVDAALAAQPSVNESVAVVDKQEVAVGLSRGIAFGQEQIVRGGR